MLADYHGVFSKVFSLLSLIRLISCLKYNPRGSLHLEVPPLFHVNYAGSMNCDSTIFGKFIPARMIFIIFPKKVL